MNFPRLRIAHQLALLLAAAVVLAVVVVGALSVWNLRSGFVDYLRVRDEEQLTRLMGLVERRAAADPTMAWLRDDPEAMRELMDEFSGRPPRRGQPDRPPPDRPPFGRPLFGFGPDRPPPPPRDGPPPDAGGLSGRVTIRDAQGQRLAGRPQAPDAHLSVRAIKVNGVEVAMLELATGPVPEGVDARFLQRQYQGLAWAAALTVLLTVLAGFWVARRWSRPLLALQHASREIARGRRSARLEPTGAREIAELMDDVNTMTGELERLESARRVWIAQISHELRTPLAVLRGEIESIEDGARQPTPTVMASLRDEVLQLGRLVDDLHTLSVADLGGLQCHCTSGDAATLLLRAALRFSQQAQQRGLRLELPAADAHPLPVCWDFGRIEQLLANLLTNSLRYTEAPGVVRVGWASDGSTVTLTVDDSAPGVPAADLPQLFEPLFRVDRARQRGSEHGSGLGLSIVRSIAQAHGGSVAARTSALGGLRMVVSLPAQASASSGSYA